MLMSFVVLDNSLDSHTLDSTDSTTETMVVGHAHVGDLDGMKTVVGLVDIQKRI